MKGFEVIHGGSVTGHAAGGGMAVLASAEGGKELTFEA